jgi:hypothetical protein
MDDGYFDFYGRTKTILICTESFTKEECIILQPMPLLTLGKARVITRKVKYKINFKNKR